jgi:hypothetical protein
MCLAIADPGGTIIACGRGFRRRRCAHCGGDAAALCDWPLMKPVPILKKLLEADFREGILGAGEVLVNKEGWRGEIRAISGLAHYLGSRAPFFEVALRVLTTTSRRYKPPFNSRFDLTLTSTAFYRVERKRTCDKPCCYRCRRHVSTNVDYCRDHWDEMARGEFQIQESLAL